MRTKRRDELSTADIETLRFLIAHEDSRASWPPTLREIGEGMNLPFGTVNGRISRLVERDLVERPPRRARALRVTRRGRTLFLAHITAEVDS